MSSRLSSEFLRLCRRIEELRKHLLPSSFDATGTYTAAQYDQTRAFVALTHAEIEAFIEVRCLSVANKCVSEWQTDQNPSSVIVALHAVCYSGWDGLIENPQFKKASCEISVEARLADALKQYGQAVGGNNGIKEVDLKRLLVPLSVRMGELDGVWVLAMENFGRVRGQIAHQSAVGVQQQPDPKYLRDLVWKELMPGLKGLDLALSELTN